MTEQPFRILTVCTGNICRSPAAELLLQAALGESIQVESAGTGALVGRGIDPGMAELLQADQISSGEFVARQLTSEHIRGADLVLAMTREHRAAVVELVPAAVRRTFTLLEFGRVIKVLPSVEAMDPTPAGRLRALLPAATQARSSASGSQDEWDIPDPYRQDAEAFETAYTLILGATDTIAARVGCESARQGEHPDGR